MRIGLIEISQETDTFNPLPTTLEDFATFGLYDGADMLRDGRGIGIAGGAVGGYLATVAASGRGIETVPITRALGVAGGRISREALAHFETRLRDGLRAAGRLDALVAQLHGACAAVGEDDVEGRLLEICREILGADLPIVVTLDHHANVTQRMVDLSDAMVAYRTQPHDPVDTGRSSAELLLRILDGSARPTTAWRKIPMLSHQEQYLTSGGPMKTWFDRARALERDPLVLSVSLFPMQPWLDVEEAGWSTVVITNHDQPLAERLADEVTDLMWSMRADFQVRTSVEPDVAVRQADAAGEGIVVLSDHGDSVFGGSPGDSTILLESMLRQRIRHRALVPLIDGAAVAVLKKAGVGAMVTLPVGGNVTGFFKPLVVTGTVRAIDRRPLRFDDLPFGEFDMGDTAVLDVGNVTLLISTNRGVAGNYPGVYSAFGVDVSRYHMAVLKTASNFQWFRPISSAVIRVNTPGPTQSDIESLPWKRVPRPIYPLDDITDWRR
jgi:microcystin degradation protein MlrC